LSKERWFKVKYLLTVSALALTLAACNNPLTNQPVTPASIAANVTQFCNAEGALSVTIAQDGTVLKATQGQQSAIAQGQELVALNCAALVAVLGTTPAPTASVPEEWLWEHQSATKLRIPIETLRRVVRRYRHP
jgi:hypothetical protein